MGGRCFPINPDLAPAEKKELAVFLAILRMKQSGEWDDAAYREDRDVESRPWTAAACCRSP
jgi:hypothetical protein